MKNILSTFLLLPLALNVFADNSQQKLIGTWDGKAYFNNEETALRVQFTSAEKELKASISLMDIGVSGWPAINVTVTDNGVNITLPSDSGPQQIKLAYEGNKLYGSWNEKNYTEQADVRLTRIEPVASREHRILPSRRSAGGRGGECGGAVAVGCMVREKIGCTRWAARLAGSWHRDTRCLLRALSAGG